MNDTGRLTAADRSAVARARELAGISSLDALREHTGVSATDMAYACALGEAQDLLAELAAVVDRLGGHA
jgi:hypothetical protein